MSIFFLSRNATIWWSQLFKVVLCILLERGQIMTQWALGHRRVKDTTHLFWEQDPAHQTKHLKLRCLVYVSVFILCVLNDILHLFVVHLNCFPSLWMFCVCLSSLCCFLFVLCFYVFDLHYCISLRTLHTPL